MTFYMLTYTIMISRIVNLIALARFFITYKEPACKKITNFSNDIATYSEILLGFVQLNQICLMTENLKKTLKMIELDSEF